MYILYFNYIYYYPSPPRLTPLLPTSCPHFNIFYSPPGLSYANHILTVVRKPTRVWSTYWRLYPFKKNLEPIHFHYFLSYGKSLVSPPILYAIMLPGLILCRQHTCYDFLSTSAFLGPGKDCFGSLISSSHSLSLKEGDLNFVGLTKYHNQNQLLKESLFDLLFWSGNMYEGSKARNLRD